MVSSEAFVFLATRKLLSLLPSPMMLPTAEFKLMNSSGKINSRVWSPSPSSWSLSSSPSQPLVVFVAVAAVVALLPLPLSPTAPPAKSSSYLMTLGSRRRTIPTKFVQLLSGPFPMGPLPFLLRRRLSPSLPLAESTLVRTYARAGRLATEVELPWKSMRDGSLGRLRAVAIKGRRNEGERNRSSCSQ